MNQLGPIFKQARTESGKSLDDAVKETKIAKKYLVAIENENFDVFPGETYLLGFLRNYSQFLGLDPDEMVLKYHDYKIQEQPAPIEQLTAKSRGGRRSILLVLVILIAAATGLYFVFSGSRDGQFAQRQRRKQVEKTEKENAETAIAKEPFVFDEEEVIRDFEEQDVIQVSWGERTHTISIDGISDDLELSIGDIPFALSTEERVEIDFNRDGRKDLLLRANWLEDGKANITLKKLFQLDGTLEDTVTANDTGGLRSSQEAAAETETAGTGTPEVVIIREDEVLSGIPVAPKSGFQIVSSYEMTPISSNAEALSTAYVAYIPDEGEKVESLLRPGETLSADAEEVLRVLATNAQGLQMQINDVTVKLGQDGAVVAKTVRWYRDPDNSDVFHLIMDEWSE
jgi:transcriptional regulator with XRE-family HTH domain